METLVRYWWPSRMRLGSSTDRTSRLWISHNDHALVFDLV